MRETEIAPPAAPEPAAEAGQAAAGAAAQAEQEARKIAEERKTAAKWFSEQVGRLGKEWSDKKIPRPRLAALGLFDMKTSVSDGIKELENISGVTMSADDLAMEKRRLSELIAFMEQITSRVLADIDKARPMAAAAQKSAIQSL